MTESKYLRDVISFADFRYEEYWFDESHVLKPRLEEKGYLVDRFENVEQDSFGPLVRAAICYDAYGREHKFIYD